MGKRHSTFDAHGNRRYKKRGITITEHRAADATLSYGAHVRLKGYKPIWQSFPTEAQCISWAAEKTATLKGERQRGNKKPDLATFTVGALISAYLADPVATVKLAPAYVKALQRSLGWWSLNYGTVKAMEFGADQLFEGRDKLLLGTVRGGKKRSAATVIRRMSAMRSCCKWGQARGRLSRDFVWPSGLMPSEPEKRERFLSDVEREKLLAAAKERSALMHAAIVTAIGTGVRASEMLGLTWNRIDFERARLTLMKTKNKKPRSVHLGASVISVLKGLKAASLVSPIYVFLDDDGKPLTYDRLDGFWRELRKAVGLTDCRWHDLRHTTASYLAQNGATLVEIASVLGHKSLQATERYAHLVDGQAVTGHDKLDQKLRGGP